MAYEMTQDEQTEFDTIIEQTIGSAQENGSRLMQIATDATRFLSVASNTIEQVKESGFFQRLHDLLPSGKRQAQMNALQSSVQDLTVSQEEIRQMQNLSWRMLEQLNERNLLTADALITVKNNLNSLAVEQNEVKTAIIAMANKVADRFEKLENRVANVESSQNLQMWIANLEDDDYEKIPTAIRFLKVIKGFYLKKQGNYTIDEIKSLRRALRNVGLDPKQTITLGNLLDTLIEELQTFDQTAYIDITKVELPDGKSLSGKELSKMLAVPSFVTICELPESKILLQDAVDALKDDLGIPYEKALQRVIKRRISRTNGINLETEETLFDLGVELISCYSAIPNLYGKKFMQNTKTASEKIDNVTIDTLDVEHLEKYSLTALIQLVENLDRSILFGDKGRRLLVYLAEQNYAPALFAVGDNLLEGEQGFPEDIQKGKELLENLVNNGSESDNYWRGRAAWTLGIYAAEDEDDNNQFYWYKKSAELGDINGMVWLADCYYSGIGTSKQPRVALTWYLNAAYEDNAYAQNMVGYFYANGKYVTQDLHEAVYWYEQAVENGSVSAKFDLGLSYYHGDGVGQDKEKGYQLIKQAAQEDYEPAQEWLQKNGYKA